MATPRTNAFCDFSSPCLWSIAPATKEWCEVIQSAALVTQNHLPQTEDRMLQNATPLRKSAPWPPNISDEHVSCTCHGKCIFADPLQMSHACHCFWTCYKTLTFCSLSTRCTISYAGAAKRHLNVQKWSKHVVFLKCWLGHVLRTTTACNFFDISTSKSAPTMVCFVHILTWKCANGVHFFDISTSKSGPSLVCFVHFDLEICFLPQRRALFQHLNFQKCC